jgi:hypothetical protein
MKYGHIIRYEQVASNHCDNIADCEFCTLGMAQLSIFITNHPRDRSSSILVSTKYVKERYRGKSEEAF